MSPPLYTSMYRAQYSSPGAVQRTVQRPTSAHRRNNPQPRADFLFPLSLKCSSRPQRPLQADPRRTPLPPIGPPHSHIINTVDRGTQLNMPPVTYLPRVSSQDHNRTSRSLSDPVLQGRPHTTAPRHRTLCSPAPGHSGCCSCFHVVKPFHRGHYTIHPQFGSEHLHLEHFKNI